MHLTIFVRSFIRKFRDSPPPEPNSLGWNVCAIFTPSPPHPQPRPLHLGHPAARRHPRPGAHVGAVRGGLQAHAEPRGAHRQAAADLPRAGLGEAED